MNFPLRIIQLYTTASILFIICLQAFDVKPLYESCHKHTSLCFGYPDGCVTKESCKILFRSQYLSTPTKQFQLELFSPSQEPDHYIAVEFSNETLMSGIVVQCHHSGDKTIVDYSFNEYGKKHNTEVNQTQVVGFVNLFGSYENSQLYCRWNIDQAGLVVYDKYSLKFNVNKYYIHLAMGKMKSNHKISYHNDDKIASASRESLNSTSAIQSEGSATLVRVHASLMIFAWIGCVTVAILMARHSRDHYPDQTLFGLRLWFLIHRCLMVLAWVAMVISYVVIFVQYKGWSKTSYHSVAGMVAGILATLQIFNSFLRPEPNSKNRWIFDYVHWIMGNLAHALAVSNIIKSSIKRQTSLLSLIISYIFVYLIFTDLLRKIGNLGLKSGNSFIRKLHQNAVLLSTLTIVGITAAMIGIIISYG